MWTENKPSGMSHPFCIVRKMKKNKRMSDKFQIF